MANAFWVLFEIHDIKDFLALLTLRMVHYCGHIFLIGFNAPSSAAMKRLTALRAYFEIWLTIVAIVDKKEPKIKILHLVRPFLRDLNNEKMIISITDTPVDAPSALATISLAALPWLSNIPIVLASNSPPTLCNSIRNWYKNVISSANNPKFLRVLDA